MIIGFIGVGKMATAIINGLNTSSHRIIISGSSLARSRQIAEELEVEAAASHQELLDKADLVILGIKPQMFDKGTNWPQFPSTYHEYGCWSNLGTPRFTHQSRPSSHSYHA